MIDYLCVTSTAAVSESCLLRAVMPHVSMVSTGPFLQQTPAEIPDQTEPSGDRVCCRHPTRPAQAPNRTRKLVLMSFPCGHKHDLRHSHLRSAALYLLIEAKRSRSLPLYLRSCLWLLGKNIRTNFLVMLGAAQRGRHSLLYQKCSGSTASHKPFSLHKMK